MLYFNFAHYVDKNKLSLNEIHEKTGISRNTLNLLYKNESKGIQLKTLNTLLNFFNISVDDFIKENEEKPEFEFSIDPDFKANILAPLNNAERQFQTGMNLNYTYNNETQRASSWIFLYKTGELLIISICFTRAMNRNVETVLKLNDLQTELLCAEITAQILSTNKRNNFFPVKKTDAIITSMQFDFQPVKIKTENNKFQEKEENEDTKIHYLWQASFFEQNYQNAIKIKHQF